NLLGESGVSHLTVPTLMIDDLWTVDKVQINISTIMLKPAQTEMNKWEGPFLYDLLNQKAEPAIEPITLKDGTYTKLEFRARPDDQDTSILLGGKVMIKGESVPFEVRIKNNEKFTIESKKGLKIEADVSNHLAVSLDASLWFAGIDLATAELSDDGKLLVTNKENKKIYQALRKNIKMSSRIGKDVDGDGEVSED